MKGEIEKGYEGNTILITQIKVDNNFTTAIRNLKFIIWEEMEKCFKHKEKFLVCRYI